MCFILDDIYDEGSEDLSMRWLYRNEGSMKTKMPMMIFLECFIASIKV